MPDEPEILPFDESSEDEEEEVVPDSGDSDGPPAFVFDSGSDKDSDSGSDNDYDKGSESSS